jgi:hypothetical protein
MGLDSMVRWSVLDKASRLIAVRLPGAVSLQSFPQHQLTR